MPRGGSRVGAGRKPHTRRERWLGGNAGKRPLALVTSSPPAKGADLLPAMGGAPNVLTPDETKYWDLWAPPAMAQGKLTEQTTPGFVVLCQQASMAAAIRVCIEGRGLEQEKVTIDGSGQEHRDYKANSLLSQWRGLMARVEQLQARYGIAADGKIVDGAGERDTDREQLAQLLSVR